MRKSVMTLILGGILLLPPTILPASSGNDSKLYDALLYADIPAMEQLLKKGANPNHLENNRSLLAWAAQDGALEAINILLSAGADPNLVDGVGHTALMRAIEARQLSAVTALLAANPDLELATADGKTAAMLAVETGEPNMVRALVGAGADFNVRDIDKNTPLMAAIGYGGDRLVQLVNILSKAGVDMDSGNAYYTPLYSAIEQKNLPLVKALLDTGANPNLKTEAGDIPLASAIYEPEVLALMLAAGADPNIRNRHGESVLFYAIDNGTPDDVKALIAAGADVNLKSSDGQTPLQRADVQVKEEIAAHLIQHGATKSGEAGNKEITAEPASQTVVSTSLTGGTLAGFPVISATRILKEGGATLFYYSSASLPDVLDFYATELDRLGFEKGFEFTDKQTYLSSKYTLDGGAYSLSLGKDTSGSTPLVMVTINAHGKRRANQLPRIANSEPLYEEDHISIYVVDDAPKAAAKKTLALLDENGWQGDISVDTDTVQTINLDKGDTTLSIMVSVAPAQNNRTTIQYSLMLKN